MRKYIIIALLIAATPLAFGSQDEARRQYAEKAGLLESGDVTGHYRLGLWCRSSGLGSQARLEFEKVVALSPDHEGARRELGYVRHGDSWLTKSESMRAKGLVQHEGVWMLPEEVKILLLPASERERIKQEQGKARRFLKDFAKSDPRVQRMARKALDGVADRYKVDPLSYALRYKAEHVRLYAAEELGRIGDRRAIRPLVYRSLMDPSEIVREKALASVKAFADPNMIAPFVKALGSRNQAIRINAAAALGSFDEILGVEYLLYRFSAHGGGLQRSHIYLTNQLSFIQDFDVEVAQTAFIADPIVGILQEGTVLDARVLATESTGWIIERRVIRRSLTKLTGVDMGDNPAKWAAWWKKNKDQLLASK